VRVELTSPILILLLLTFRLYVAGMGRSLRGDGGGEISSKSAMGVEGTFHLFRLESGKQRRQQDQSAVPGGLGAVEDHVVGCLYLALLDGQQRHVCSTCF
jgi:hypothetical protein